MMRIASVMTGPLSMICMRLAEAVVQSGQPTRRCAHDEIDEMVAAAWAYVRACAEKQCVEYQEP